MKFAHISDVHIGSWRDPKMRDVSTRTFSLAVDTCIKESINFLLIAGDLFDTALPGIDLLKEVTSKLKELKDHSIPVYLIAGSHDFSPSGKTMLDVLENAGLCRNVAKGEEIEGKLKLQFTVDPNTSAKITGIFGKKGMLDHYYYEHLLRGPLEEEPGYKIFMFHTAIAEFKPKDLQQMEAHPLSLLPKNFDYYAGGHVHYIEEFSSPGYKRIVYPGALYPCNFAELQKYSHGYLHIIENDAIRKIPLKLYDCIHIVLDLPHCTPQQITNKITTELQTRKIKDAIITLHIAGSLDEGKVSDINFSQIYSSLYDQGAYMVMKNTSKLISKEFEDIQLPKQENFEDALIKEHLGKMPFVKGEEEFMMIKNLIASLSIEKKEGEKIQEFELRVKEVAKLLLKLE